jgi:hypothetical protein
MALSRPFRSRERALDEDGFAREEAPGRWGKSSPTPSMEFCALGLDDLGCRSTVEISTLLGEFLQFIPQGATP